MKPSSNMMNLKHRRINEYNDMLCIDLDNDSETHLFRHASEITRETKGGYLKGKISIPMTDKPCYLRLSLVPAERDGFNDKDLHPNMLHINLRQNKKTRQIQVIILFKLDIRDAKLVAEQLLFKPFFDWTNSRGFRIISAF